ncbi:MAG: DUF4268 domain-containing protein [Candidatus Kapaibacterium sp.]|jgi:hypothetical protein
MCRISFYFDRVSLSDKEQWETMLEFHVTNMIKLESSMREYLKSVKRKLHDKVMGKLYI